MMPTIRLLAAAFALATGVLAAGASAAELKVLSVGGMRTVLQELGPAFEAASGHKLNIDYAEPRVIEQKVVAGDEIDVAILTKPRADKLVREAKIVGGTATTLARPQIGLAVKKGAAKPDISSIEAFKKALLNAKSVAYPDPAGGSDVGAYMVQTFDKLGIAAELKPKTLVSPNPAQAPVVVEAVARGEAEIGITVISALMQVQGIDIVGLLPAELQDPNLVLVAGSPFFSEQPIAAKALIDFLADPKAAAVYRAKGFQPG
jgi:molybdate transport system substrate-binding protein